jgi:hypothetical protein
LFITVLNPSPYNTRPLHCAFRRSFVEKEALEDAMATRREALHRKVSGWEQNAFNYIFYQKGS